MADKTPDPELTPDPEPVEAVAPQVDSAATPAESTEGDQTLPVEVETAKSVDAERAEQADHLEEMAKAQADADAAAADPESVDPDPPVYDERGNVRPRGTEGARPMDYDERVDVAEQVEQADAERLEAAEADPEAARFRDPEPEPEPDAEPAQDG